MVTAGGKQLTHQQTNKHVSKQCPHALAHPLNLDHSDIKDQCGIGRYDHTHPCLPVAQGRRDGDSATLPQTGPLESTVHASNDPPVTKGNNVGGVVVKAAYIDRQIDCNNVYCVCVLVCVCVLLQLYAPLLKICSHTHTHTHTHTHCIAHLLPNIFPSDASRPT